MKFGRLSVLAYGYFPIGDLVTRWNNQWVWCQCDCGKMVFTRYKSVKYYKTKSCGCLNREKMIENGKKTVTHGQSRDRPSATGFTGTRSYRSWVGMKQRCQNKNYHHYNLYGGRGIKVCDEWNSFENFYKDMGDCPEGSSLDRINVNGDYNKNNCKWSTRKEQARNRRDTVYIEHEGNMIDINTYCEITGNKRGKIASRYYRKLRKQKCF